ncbi:hypothetical protein [Streptomyces sp. NPDC058572]|uniref:hypothetical protein n=1 Tax=Streptomyces sp. NPDC058572 TaxID=3346546 RepID=UPI003650967A
MIRNSVRYVARQDRDKVADDLIRPVCTAPGEAAATERFLNNQDQSLIGQAPTPGVIRCRRRLGG